MRQSLQPDILKHLIYRVTKLRVDSFKLARAHQTDVKAFVKFTVKIPTGTLKLADAAEFALREQEERAFREVSKPILI